MKGLVKLYPHSVYVTLKEYKLFNLNDYDRDGNYLYHVAINYGHPDNGIGTLYAFKIVKETDCYFFLENKHRVNKHLRTNRNFADSPAEAFILAVNRAANYRHMLTHKLARINDVMHIIKRECFDLKALKDEFNFSARESLFDDEPEDHPLF